MHGMGYEMKFSDRSLKNLEGVHPALVRVVKKALEYAEIDFTVTCGLRTPEEQKALYAKGRTEPGPIVTWTLKSNHLPKYDGYGYAVDLHPYPIDYDNMERYYQLASIMTKASDECGVPITRGIDWQKKDPPHYELAA